MICTLHIVKLHLKTLIVFISLICSLESLAQTKPEIVWDATFGGSGWEQLENVTTGTDGGYVFIGATSSPQGGQISGANRGISDFWVVKTDDDGNLQWENRYGGNDLDRALAVSPTPDGGYVIAGDSYSSAGDVLDEKSEAGYGQSDFWMVKIDQFGNFLWDKTFGGSGEDRLFGISATADGGYVLAGFSQLFEFKETSDGGFLLGGSSESGVSPTKDDPNQGLNDFYAVKIDGDGNMQWNASFGGSVRDVMLNAIETNDGGYLFAGHSDSDASGDKTENTIGNNGIDDYWLVKTDINGNKEWDRTLGGEGRDIAYGLHQNPYEYYLVGGISESNLTGDVSEANQGGGDYWFVYVDDSGKILWDRTFGGTNDDVNVLMYQANDGGFIVGGHSQSDSNEFKSQNSFGMNDYWIIKTDCPLTESDLFEDQSICAGDTIILSPEVGCDACLYEWSDGFDGEDRMFIPEDDVELSFTAAHVNGCQFTEEVTIEVSPRPEIDKVDIQSEVCAGDKGSIEIKNVKKGTKPFSYSIQDDIFVQEDLFTALEPAAYTLVVQDAIGCTDQMDFEIFEAQALSLELGPSYDIQLGESIEIVPLTNPDLFDFEWSGDVDVPCNDCITQDFQPFETTELQSVKRMEVFNRWGERIFSNENFPPNTYAEGWDGTFKGEKVDSGVYSYFVEIQYVDGSIEVLEGNITLIR